MNMKNMNGYEEEKYYLVDEAQFNRIYEIISNMPNFVIYDSYETSYMDYFYDTPDMFLEQNGASCRVRRLDDVDLLSLKYLSYNVFKEEKVREHYMELPLNTNLAQHKQALLFLSNQINDVYSNRLEIDTFRKFRDLKVFMAIHTIRKVYQLKNNEDLKINVKFDHCLYQTKFVDQKDIMAKIELLNYPDSVNMETFQRFVKVIRQKVGIIPDNESKYTAAKRAFKIDRFNKKPKEEITLEVKDSDKK